MIRLALMLGYSSCKTDKRLLNETSLTSLSVLKQLRSAEVDSQKVAKLSLEKQSVLSDCALIID